MIIDTVMTASSKRIAELLAPDGRVVLLGSTSRGKILGPAGALFAGLIAGRLRRIDARHVLARVRADDLGQIASWLADGTLTPVIQQVVPLERVHDALAELERGHVAGKLVVRVAESV